MAGTTRRRADLALGLEAWLQSRSVDPVEVTLERPQSGLSSETLLVETTLPSPWHSLVVRLPPSGGTTFPDYDLARQVAVQAALAATDIPVAEPLAFEQEDSWLGAPFLVMPRLPGRTLATSPPYPGAGWLAEADANTQRRICTDFVGLLARIHRLDYSSLDLGQLSGGGPELSGMLDYWSAYLDWATPDTEGAQIYRDAIDWLRERAPDPAPPCLLWGDPQLVNLVYDEQASPVAVLDWEMACLGPAEVDLGWFIALHEGAVETAGRDLAGYPGRAELVRAYEAALGREVRDLEWYELFAHVRSGAIVLRIGALLATAGVPHTWTAKVPQPRHVRRLLQAS